MGKQPIIKTERLILRPFDVSDSKRVQELAGDVKVAKTTLNIPYPYEDGMAEVWINTHIDSFNKGSDITYAVVKKDTNELIGAISLMAIKKFIEKQN